MFDFKLVICVQNFRSCPHVYVIENLGKLRKGLSKLSNKGTFLVKVFVCKKLLKLQFKRSFHRFVLALAHGK